jgi:hypothetical protein
LRDHLSLSVDIDSVHLDYRMLSQPQAHRVCEHEKRMWLGDDEVANRVQLCPVDWHQAKGIGIRYAAIALNLCDFSNAAHSSLTSAAPSASVGLAIATHASA